MKRHRIRQVTWNIKFFTFYFNILRIFNLPDLLHENHYVSDHKMSSHNNLLGIIMPDLRTIHLKEQYFVWYLISVLIDPYRIIMGNSFKNFSEISIFPVLTQDSWARPHLTISPHPMTDGDKWSYRRVCWFMFLILIFKFRSKSFQVKCIALDHGCPYRSGRTKIMT